MRAVRVLANHRQRLYSESDSAALGFWFGILIVLVPNRLHVRSLLAVLRRRGELRGQSERATHFLEDLRLIRRHVLFQFLGLQLRSLPLERLALGGEADLPFEPALLRVVVEDDDPDNQ